MLGILYFICAHFKFDTLFIWGDALYFISVVVVHVIMVICMGQLTPYFSSLFLFYLSFFCYQCALCISYASCIYWEYWFFQYKELLNFNNSESTICFCKRFMYFCMFNNLFAFVFIRITYDIFGQSYIYNFIAYSFIFILIRCLIMLYKIYLFHNSYFSLSKVLDEIVFSKSRMELFSMFYEFSPALSFIFMVFLLRLCLFIFIFNEAPSLFYVFLFTFIILVDKGLVYILLYIFNIFNKSTINRSVPILYRSVIKDNRLMFKSSMYNNTLYNEYEQFTELLHANNQSLNLFIRDRYSLMYILYCILFFQKISCFDLDFCIKAKEGMDIVPISDIYLFRLNNYRETVCLIKKGLQQYYVDRCLIIDQLCTLSVPVNVNSILEQNTSFILLRGYLLQLRHINNETFRSLWFDINMIYINNLIHIYINNPHVVFVHILLQLYSRCPRMFDEVHSQKERVIYNMPSYESDVLIYYAYRHNNFIEKNMLTYIKSFLLCRYGNHSNLNWFPSCYHHIFSYKHHAYRGFNKFHITLDSLYSNIEECYCIFLDDFCNFSIYNDIIISETRAEFLKFFKERCTILHNNGKICESEDIVIDYIKKLRYRVYDDSSNLVKFRSSLERPILVDIVVDNLIICIFLNLHFNGSYSSIENTLSVDDIYYDLLNTLIFIDRNVYIIH